MYLTKINSVVQNYCNKIELIKHKMQYIEKTKFTINLLVSITKLYIILDITYYMILVAHKSFRLYLCLGIYF